MAELLLEPVYWNWLLLGLVLMVIEILAPGTFFLWLGMAALATGGLLMLSPTLGWQWQLLLFAALAVGSTGLWQLYTRRRPQQADASALNRRGVQYIGRELTLDAPIVNRQGRARIDDSSWKIEGPDCPAGTRVKIVGVDGIVLKVAANEP
jgi:membrane protein implicated in regulation of membrane protease activity